MVDKKTKMFHVYDGQTFILALIIISSYIVYFGIVLFTMQENSFEGVKNISATFGTIVASVIGYYFGNRPVQAASKQAEVAQGERDKYAGEFRDLYNQIDIGKKEYNELKEELENLKKQFGDR